VIEPKVQRILDAIKSIYGDTSVSPQKTLERLQDIHDEVEIRIDAIESDL